MGRQIGPLRIEGKVGGLSFYRSMNKDLVRTPGGPTAEKIKTDPKMRRTLENTWEFGDIGHVSKLIRDPLKPHLPHVTYNFPHYRLTKVLRKILVTDKVSDRGHRNVMKGDPALLTHFHYNQLMRWDYTYFGNITHQMDVSTGKAETKLTLDPFCDMKSPSGATHFSTKSILNIVPKSNDGYTISSDETYSPITSVQVQHLHQIAPDIPTDALILHLIRIKFYQEVNGYRYEVKEKGGYTVKILEAMMV